jgi:TonB family protein
MESSITPPDPEMPSRFDFKRLPVPIDKARKLIVLKGILKEDGTVGNVEVYQGVLQPMDEAAKAAFSKWKFKPAIRDGKPIAVDFLVGIPAEVVSSRPLR